MAKSNIWLEETNTCINDLPIGYMMNPFLHTKKYFREQVKGCLKNTFSPSINTHIGKILLKDNKIVLALVILYKNRKTNTRKMFIVLSCVIYTIIRKYVCIDYFGSGKKKKVIYVLAFLVGTNIFIRIMTMYWDLEFQIYY